MCTQSAATTISNKEVKYMKKLFISCPMKGRTEKAIKDSMNRLHSLAEIVIGEKLEAIDSYIENAPEFKDGTPENKIRLWYLGESIKKIGEADVFIGSSYDGMYPGCDVEQETARKYGIHMIYLPESIVFDIMPDVEEAILKRWDNCAKAVSID